MSDFQTLSITELTALSKLVDRELDARKDAGQSVNPGNHQFDFGVHIRGSLARGEDTQASPNFAMDKYLKPLLLRYAATLGNEEGKQWLTTIMSPEGALGAVIELGADVALKAVDPTMIKLYEASESEAKRKFREITPKIKRIGNTVVAADVTITPQTNDLPDTFDLNELADELGDGLKICVKKKKK